MEKVYEYADDIHVKSKIAHVVSSELWGDADFPTPISKAEAIDAFKKGMLVIQTGENAFANPDSVNGNGQVVVGANTYTVRTEALEVDPEQQSTVIYSTYVSAMQGNDVAVANNAITGTIKYLDDGGEIAGWWGAGNFLCLKFTAPQAITSAKIGLFPHYDEDAKGLAYNDGGLVEIIGDADMNGVFKITDKDIQRFKVVATDGIHKAVQYYDLSGLTCKGKDD